MAKCDLAWVQKAMAEGPEWMQKAAAAYADGGWSQVISPDEACSNDFIRGLYVGIAICQQELLRATGPVSMVIHQKRAHAQVLRRNKPKKGRKG